MRVQIISNKSTKSANEKREIHDRVVKTLLLGNDREGRKKENRRKKTRKMRKKKRKKGKKKIKKASQCTT